MKKRKRLLLFGTAGVMLSLWLSWGNYSLEVERYTVTDERIPEAFSGFRIAQVSDLHNASLGAGNSRLLELLAREQPDIILITGDLIDSRKPDMAVAESFVRAAVQIAPVYYVSGNHEARLDLPAIREMLRSAGAVILDNEKCILSRQGQSITLLGIPDPIYIGVEPWKQALHGLAADAGGYTVLLSHRPERFDDYKAAGICLTFAGHAHGGQVRLPFLGGLLAPEQGWFPEYDSGMFTCEGSTMLVSRGLGDSIVPLRVGNRRMLLIAQLLKGQ